MKITTLTLIIIGIIVIIGIGIFVVKTYQSQQEQIRTQQQQMERQQWEIEKLKQSQKVAECEKECKQAGFLSTYWEYCYEEGRCVKFDTQSDCINYCLQYK